MNILEKELLTNMLDNRWKVSIKKCGNFCFYSEYRFEMHKHTDLEINYVTAGRCIMEVAGKVISLKKGDCIVINPMVEHCFWVDMGMNCRILQLEHSVQLPKFLWENVSCFNYDVTYYVISGCQELYTAMDILSKLYFSETEDLHHQTQFDLALMSLYVLLSREKKNLKGESDISDGVFGKILAEINRNFVDKINMETLAQQFGVSSRYIRKEFIKRLGVNSSEYITLLRINKARYLLWHTDKPITEVAFCSGFGSSQYFCKVFRRQIGKTPYEYRNEWTTDQDDKVINPIDSFN